MLIQLDTDADTERRSLVAWLRNEPDISHGADIAMTGPPSGPDRMGPMLDVIQLTLDSGFQLASLVVAIAAWRQTQPQQPRVIIRHGDVEVAIAGDDPQTITRIVAALESATPDHTGPDHAGPARTTEA